MGWRDRMGAAAAVEYSKPYTQSVQKGEEKEPFAPIALIAPKYQKVKTLDEPETGVNKWIMESPILGRVSLAYDPKQPD